MQTTGSDALLTCRSAGPHEIYWVDPNGKPVDIKSKKYQVCDKYLYFWYNIEIYHIYLITSSQ